MTTFLGRTGMDLALAAVTAPLAICGLHRILPAPHVGFLAVASTMNIHVGIAIRDWATQSTTKSKQQGVDANKVAIFERLYAIVNVTTGTLLTIFIRSVGQRMGIQVPGYLQTVGYIYIASSAFWITKNTVDILRLIYNSPQAKK